MMSTFLLSFDAEIHPSWLRPGCRAYWASWACAYAVLGGSIALCNATFDPSGNNSGWQIVPVCGYFVYYASTPAICVIFFKAHRDESNHLLRALMCSQLGRFI